MPPRRLTPPRVAALVAAALALSSGRAASSQAPPPVADSTLGFPLPGDHPTPATGASASLSLSDRWLGSSAYENPAAKLPAGIEVTPVFQRTSRQDLAAQNRDFEQTFGYFDIAGAAWSLPFKNWGLVVYGWQPVLRLEEQTYTTGPLVQPAQINQLDTQREIRAGGAVSRAFGTWRAGISGEWVHRDDQYEKHEQGGDPAAVGDETMKFSGNGYGVNGGITYERDPDKVWGMTIGAAAHYGSELNVSGTVDEHLLVQDTTFSFEATRTTEWSGGLSARVMVAPATRVLLGLTGRTGSDWNGFGFGTSKSLSWSLGLDWKDDELPWGARFGVGQENDPGAVEPAAGLLSIGFTYVMSGDLVLDLGLLHRNVTRADLAGKDFPHSADNRAVLTVKVGF